MAGLHSTYLIALARLKTVESRAALAETISDLFSDTGDFLTDRERASMSSILRKIVGDIEKSLRTAFCDTLARSPDEPKSSVADLRVGDVAYAVLSRSPALQAEDLIEVVRHRYLEYRLALALRESPHHGDRMVPSGTGEKRSITEALLHNANTDVARRTMDYLLEQAKRVDATHEPVVRQEELGPELIKRIFLWVAAALRQHILQACDLDEMVVDEVMERVAFEQVAVVPDAPEKNQADKLADELAKADLLKPGLLLATLAEGEVALFIALFARSTGLRGGLVRRLLFEPGGEGLAIACKGVRFPVDVFSRLFALSRMARPQLQAQIRIETKKAEAFYDLLQEQEAAQVLRKWRLRPDYAAAVRGVQLAATASP